MARKKYRPWQPNQAWLFPPKERMRWKLDTPSNLEIYKMRKASMGPVCGQIKEARGFRSSRPEAWPKSVRNGT